MVHEWGFSSIANNTFLSDDGMWGDVDKIPVALISCNVLLFYVDDDHHHLIRHGFSEERTEHRERARERERTRSMSKKNKRFIHVLFALSLSLCFARFIRFDLAIWSILFMSIDIREKPSALHYTADTWKSMSFLDETFFRQISKKEPGRMWSRDFLSIERICEGTRRGGLPSFLIDRRQRPSRQRNELSISKDSIPICRSLLCPYHLLRYAKHICFIYHIWL